MKMTNTALRAENSNSRTITFKSREHEKFYEEYLKKCRYQDVYHQALVYCLGIDRDTRNNVDKRRRAHRLPFSSSPHQMHHQ